MRSDTAKVLHRAAGRTLLDWVLDAVAVAKPDRTVVVVGHQAEAVAASLEGKAETVVQEPQNGTGHAVQVALAHLGELEPDDTVLVTYGDMPLVPADVYEDLASRPSDAAVVLTTVDPGPPGFGRVKRDAGGRVVGIVEERDCDPSELEITERNVGLYAFAAGALAEALSKLTPDNSQGELYLTDVVGHIADAGGAISVRRVAASDVSGVNSHADLALVQAIAADEGASAVVHERDPDARARLWQARHDVAHALAARFPGTKERTTAVCVPLTELAAAVRFARTEIDRLGLEAGILGHAGDGNLHVAMQVTPEGVPASEELVHAVVDDALARGGTCTGEHGVGQGKIGALEQEHGDLIPLMQAIRASFDPHGIMNPGKVLPPVPGAAA